MDVVKRLLDSKLFWFVCGVLTVASVASIVHRQLRRDPRFLARPEFAGARVPGWADRRVLDPVMERLDALGPVSLLDPDFEEKIRGALDGCPVLAGVPAVRRRWPRGYSVRVVFRRPWAVIETDGARIPVTAEGLRLPEENYDLRGLYVVKGVLGPPPEPGRPFDSEALRDGLATLRQLAPHLPRLQPLGIHAVDVTEAGSPRGGVVLRTDRGIPVRWGRPRARVGENPVETKIRLLLAAQEDLAALTGYTIDVRYDQPYVRESPAP